MLDTQIFFDIIIISAKCRKTFRKYNINLSQHTTIIVCLLYTAPKHEIPNKNISELLTIKCRYKIITLKSRYKTFKAVVKGAVNSLSLLYTVITFGKNENKLKTKG